MNCQVEIIGDKPSHALAFATLLDPQERPQFTHATAIARHHIFGFDARRGTNVVSSPAGINVMVVEVEPTQLRSLADCTGRYDLDDGFWQQNMITVAPEAMADYAAYLRQLQHLIDDHPEQLHQPAMRQLIRGDLLPLLMDALHDRERPPKPLRRADIVEAAQAYMAANLHRPITLQDLTEAVCASRRSLIYGFQDVFGMGPIAYLKKQRLNGVRQALLNGHPRYETVINIARLWGFYSPGHFARDYKTLFGESPSATLQQGR
jgi:AraC family ethanolamine operon transcriptional activator